jgi:hypothetical protein
MEYVYAFALTGFVGAVQAWLDGDMRLSTRAIAELLVKLFYRVSDGPHPREG